ncbi:RES family NAD+ phosphorylase [Sphingomonas oligophenolica]|uniref:RES domain-containing protein n=1 Tax=Sphingomonas oligophenolica TaxID=301154 RepID=A0A502CLS1_9SPHN|nr:RES family NAD+ phosphorylase [Sphingomonas oligophenolica]TPG12716.1 RES domain-containing protein [Sphingomonas oligophenolica]
MAPAIPLLAVSGRFYRSMIATRADAVIDAPGPISAGRYHRPGEPALYITREPEWAGIAVRRYSVEDGLPRVIVPVDLSEARVFDQRDAAACASLGIDPDRSNQDWRAALAAGEEPGSWVAADRVRRIGADGIVDRSRSINGGWHVALFRWNGIGGPTVTVAGAAVPCD